VYSLAISCDISKSPQFRECFQLLSFQSREELLDKVEKVISILQGVSSDLSVKVSHLKDIQQKLSKYYTEIVNMRIKSTDQPLKSPSKIDIGENISRYQLKEVSTGSLFPLNISDRNMHTPPIMKTHQMIEMKSG
jgi:origin recognition complex subunit 3